MHLRTASFHLLSFPSSFFLWVKKAEKEEKKREGGVFGIEERRGKEKGALSIVLQQIVGLSVKLWEGGVSEGNEVKPELLTDR